MVENMSRRRSLNPTKAISITLKQSTIDGKWWDTQSIHEWSIDGIIAHLLHSRDLTIQQKEIILLFSKSF